MIHEKDKNLLVHNLQLLNCPLSSLQVNPAIDPTPRNSIETFAPSTTKPAFMRFTLQVEDVAGMYNFQSTFSFSMSEIAVMRKVYQADGIFWNTVVLPGGPAYKCNVLLWQHNEDTSYKHITTEHLYQYIPNSWYMPHVIIKKQTHQQPFMYWTPNCVYKIMVM